MKVRPRGFGVAVPTAGMQPLILVVSPALSELDAMIRKSSQLSWKFR